ncbi:MAG: hypothetical protein VX498_05365 [Myxococcota bacterium]|nr:hypothetical protein [Myxococcota bacterium]
MIFSCESDYSYRDLIADRVDIHDIAECLFDETDEGWEQYTCVPVFASSDTEAQAWERTSIDDFDIIQREIFGAPFYQMWYSGIGGDGANDGFEIGYALSMDGIEWKRHPYNPVLRRGSRPDSFDRDHSRVACVAFDGDKGVFHLWYKGDGTAGTTFGHASSADGIFWDKDLLNPLDPFEDTEPLLDRVWSCDALYEDGAFHFWVGGPDNNNQGGIGGNAGPRTYDIAYLSTTDGVNFQGGDALALEHDGAGSELFDAEGVNHPSVFIFDDSDPASTDGRYWMLYSGYQSVTTSSAPGSNLISFQTEGERLGMANSPHPGGPWEKLSSEPVPLNFSGLDTADNARAFFINGRLHVFFTDQFSDPLDGTLIGGIGLGISPFPIQEAP